MCFVCVIVWHLSNKTVCLVLYLHWDLYIAAFFLAKKIYRLIKMIDYTLICYCDISPYNAKACVSRTATVNLHCDYFSVLENTTYSTLWWTGRIPYMMYSRLAPSVPSIGYGSTTTLTRIQLWLNGWWMSIVHSLHWHYFSNINI